MKKLSSNITLVILFCSGLSVLLVLVLGFYEVSRLVRNSAAESLSWMMRSYANQFSSEFLQVEYKVQKLYEKVYATVDVDALLNDPHYLPAYSQELEEFFASYAASDTISPSAYCYFNPELSSQPYDIYYASGTGDKVPQRQAHLPLDYYNGIPEPQDDKYWWYGPVESKELVWTNPYEWQLVSGEVIKVVSCVKPVYVEGTLVAVVGTSFRFNTILEALNSLRVYQTGFATLVNEKMDIIIHPKYRTGTRNNSDNLSTVDNSIFASLTQQMAAQDSGSLTYTYNGKSRSTLYRRLSNGWTLCLTAPTSEIYADAYAIFPKLLLAILFCAVVSILIARSMGNLLARPILRMVDATREIGGGNFDVHLDLATTDEIRVLGNAINDMVGNIRSLNQELVSAAYYDPLTGMGNKSFFEKQAAQMLEDSPSLPRAYVVLDISKFKLINDLFGIEEGNRLLRHIADSVTSATDELELCARFNADCFHMLWLIESRGEIEDRLQALYNSIVGFQFPQGPSYKLSVGFGAYLLGAERPSVSLMGDRAKLALSSIKGAHTFSLHFYNDNLMNKILEEQEIENSMEAALQNGEFKVYLQPKYDPYNVAIIGAEALVRWQHPVKGLVPPNEFIPIFERNGFIADLDRYMLDQVCQLLRRWLDDGVVPLQISVNQSRKYLSAPSYIPGLLHTVDSYQIPHNLLELEITETAFFDNQAEMVRMISKLHELGFVVSLDDFGSGYSSFNMLQDMMVDVLKIDKNFFRDSIHSERGKKIVANIITMAQELRIVVVSEGVETTEQVDFLKRCNCDLIQGYYFARPMPMEELDRMARENIDRMHQL